MERGDARPGQRGRGSGAGGHRSPAGLCVLCTAARLPRWPLRRSAVCRTSSHGLRVGSWGFRASVNRPTPEPWRPLVASGASSSGSTSAAPCLTVGAPNAPGSPRGRCHRAATPKELPLIVTFSAYRTPVQYVVAGRAPVGAAIRRRATDPRAPKWPICRRGGAPGDSRPLPHRFHPTRNTSICRYFPCTPCCVSRGSIGWRHHAKRPRTAINGRGHGPGGSSP